MNEHVKDWSIELGKFAAELVGESVINHSGIGDIKLLCKLGSKVWNKVCEDAIDHSVEVLDEREKEFSNIISKITPQKLPNDFEDFYQLINAAAEICLDRLYIFYYKYNVEETAERLAKEYIQKNQMVYGEKELGLLRNHLKEILQETIKKIGKDLQANSKFTEKWRRYVVTALQDHKTEIVDLKKQNILIDKQIDGLTSRVEHVENDVCTMKKDIEDFQSNNIKIEVRECNRDYKMNWNDVLFLEDPDSEKAVHLKDVHVLPTYQDKQKNDNKDLHDLLQSVIDAGNNFRKRMLVILGQPGSGKTTLITYLLNKCHFQENRLVRMYCFRNFKQVNWENTDEIFPQMLESMHLQEKDLNDSVLILDGLDEVNMGNRQTEFLNDIYKKYIRTEEIKNFSLFITCRNNRIGDVEELKPRYINVNSLNEGQIKQFVEKYNRVKGENNYIKLLQELKDVVGIPIILYIILAKKIEIHEETNLVNIYDMIFLPSSPYNIYSRSKYDEPHVIASVEKDQIFDFSKKVSVKMWSDNPNEASLKKVDYEKIAENIIGKEKSKDLLIGQYFMEGEDSSELYFVHRSMYQYFVALSIFDSIKNMIDQGSPSEQFKELVKNSHSLNNSCISTFARIAGMNVIYSDPDIEQYLLCLLKKLTIEDEQWWKTFFARFLDIGLTRYVDDFEESTINCFKREVNRFQNLVWLTREQLRCIDSSKRYYKVANIDDKFLFYLGRGKYRVDLKEIDLIGADLIGADLIGADLRGADLSNAKLYGADLSNAFLSGADLSNAKLYGADLSNAFLSGADLSNANLHKSDLRGAILDDITVDKEALRVAILDEKNYKKFFGDESESNE